MSKNTIAFRDFMKEKNFLFEEWSAENVNYFGREENIIDGPRLRVVVGINKEDTGASVYIGNFATVTNPSKRDYSLQLINELNMKYTYNKFTMDNKGNILIGNHFPVTNNFNPESIWVLILSSIQTAEEEYPKFMKLQWS